MTLIVPMALASCGGSDSAVDPFIGGGKGDVSDQVNRMGPIAVGAQASGDFVDDLQFDGYTFRVAADAAVRLDVTHTGSSASLDDTLFVYGPSKDGDDFGNQLIAEDDDSGWGNHARIGSLQLEQEGIYLVVIGTYDGKGRGKYRLALECVSENCEPARPESDQCPSDIEEWIIDCARNQVEGDETTEMADGVEICLHTPFAGLGDEPYDVFEELCDLGSASSWCSLGFDVFLDELIPMCEKRVLDSL